MRQVFKMYAVFAMLLLGGPHAFAQSLLSQDNQLQFTLAPETPGPDETVLIEVQGVGTFLGNSTITWQVNGKVIQSGVGKNSFSFTVGKIGSKTEITAIIESSEKGVITRNFTFIPSRIHMLWEAQTSAPLWYKGKTLYTGGSELSITALPEITLGGKAVPPENFSYQWSRNGSPVPQNSGKGRNVLIIKGNQLLSQEVIGVEVVLQNTVLGKGEVTIPSAKTDIILYAREPLRGILFDKAIAGTVQLNKSEFTLEAARFNFDNTSISAGSVQYIWKLNNKVTSGPQTNEGALTLRQSGNGTGNATLEVSSQNTDPEKYVQSASRFIQILYGGNSSSQSLFGL